MPGIGDHENECLPARLRTGPHHFDYGIRLVLVQLVNQADVRARA
jgi:hypothetical protein